MPEFRGWVFAVGVGLLALSLRAAEVTNKADAVASTNAAKVPARSLLREMEDLFGGSETTPKSFPDAQAFIYRDLKPEPLRLFVVKPEGWKTNDHRPALVYFFGGAWTRGTPEKSIGWARMAAKWGMVGIAPDYRTSGRFQTSPVEAVADARAAMRWVQDHAAELGIDTNKLAVGGNSAGGHLALWTALTKTPYGSKPEEAPTSQPAALLLVSAPGETTPEAFDHDPKKLKRFGPHMMDVSPLQNLDAKMPPVLMFHGDADPTVPYRLAVALHAKLVATSNVCEFITVTNGGHGLPLEWKDKSRAMMKDFFIRQHVLPGTR